MRWKLRQWVFGLLKSNSALEEVPSRVIRETEDGYFEIDHDYCRPCGICAQECPAGAIEFRAGE